MTSTGETNTPYPPRFWWMKRLSLLGVVIVCGLGGLRAWWGQHAGQLLAAERDRVRAAGEPLEPEDLNRPSLPPGRNAATFLNQAITIKARSRVFSPSESILEYRDYPPYPPQWHKLADAAVTTHAGVFPLLRNARTLDEADWGVQYGNPAAMFPSLNSTRALANLATDTVLREHVHGNDAAALELVRDVRHMAALRSREPLLLSHLVSLGLDALALARLNAIAPDLAVTPGDDVPAGAAAPAGPATRGQVDALIAELLRDSPDDDSRLAIAMRGERVLGAVVNRTITGGNWLLRPMFQLDERRVMVHHAQYLSASTQPTLARALAASPRSPKLTDRRRISRSVSAAVASNFEGITRQNLRIRTERRFAAASLAVRLYRIDHDDQWPPSLDALVPTYLPAFPGDPFDPAGGPLRYTIVRGGLPLGGGRPVVYSLSDNGTDETANGQAPLDLEPRFSWHGWGSTDQRRDLARWVPLADIRAVGSALFRLPQSDPDGPVRGDIDGDGIPDEPATTASRPPPATAPTTTPSSDAVDHEPDEADHPGDDE